MRSVELEDHLTTCADCNLTLESHRALKSLLQNAGLKTSAPGVLRTEILNSLRAAPAIAVEEAAPEEKTLPEVKALPRRPWISFPALRWPGAAAVFVVLAATLMVRLRTTEEQKLAEQVVDNHITVDAGQPSV